MTGAASPRPVGRIFDIQRGSAVDGPGLRTTVFFQGCNLRCRWCHNPESWFPQPRMMVYRNKCTGCGHCVEVCPHRMASCDFCGKCVLLCPHDARKICGREASVEEVMEPILRDVDYYRESGGGATFSGGECMLQPDFLEALLRQCREREIPTAVDTAGAVPWESFERILPWTDLFLYDVKCVTDALHREWTGVSSRLPRENLRRLSSCAKVLVRVPVIPGVNTGDEMAKIAAWLKELHLNHEVELLPYHRLGESKYEALSLPYTPFGIPTPAQMAEYQTLFA